MITDRNEARVRGLHEKFLGESLKQINDSIGHSSGESVPSTTKEPGNLDKVNEIRNEVAGAPVTRVLDPNAQSEVLKIVKQKCEEFKKELTYMPFVDDQIRESEVEKFKEDLLDNIDKKLTKRK